MGGQVSSVPNAIYDILICDADGRHLELESFEDLENAPPVSLDRAALSQDQGHSVEPVYPRHCCRVGRLLARPLFMQKHFVDTTPAA